MALPAYSYGGDSGPSDSEIEIRERMDSLRVAMDAEMIDVRSRCLEYLSWYSPEWDRNLLRHDAWDEAIMYQDIGTSRNNFPICRAVVDIWAALESGTPPSSRAEVERVPLPPPVIDQVEADMLRQEYSVDKAISSRRADMRSYVLRKFRRLDDFRRKNYLATLRKNLYGFTWVKVIPDTYRQRPVSHVIRNPTTVYPLWSTRDPDDIEAILAAYQENAGLANARWSLGLSFKDGKVTPGHHDPRYQDLARWFDSTMTMVWIEEFWWIERGDFDRSTGRSRSSIVHMVTRVCDRIVEHESFEWDYLPFVPFVNADERSTYGWSDLAGVLDINDELNKRLSQQGDVIGMYSQPRFQLTGASIAAVEREMPGPFELISLSDTERIEQILTRIDVFPTNYHVDQLFDLLHRVSGLPPIVWGMIQNAQTSGRALTASWKATETRLAPKLMSDEHAIRRWDAITIDYIRRYDWERARSLFTDRRGQPFLDFTYDFPPMEPRDFQEVTMNAITKRDAGLIPTISAMRETGDEKAEDTIEEVKAEWMDPVLHPDKVQARELLRQIAIQNDMAEQEAAAAQAAPAPAAPPAAAPGAPPGLPPGGPPGAVPPGLAPGGGLAVEPSILMRQGEISNQQQITGPPIPLGGGPPVA